MSNASPFCVVAADVKAAIDAITDDLKWFAGEAKAAIAWVDRSVPGAQQALAVLFQAADEAASVLETQASGGLADIVGNAVADAGVSLANLISASGLNLGAKAVLTAADVATVTAAKAIAQHSVAVAAARLLGAAAPAVSPPDPKAS